MTTFERSLDDEIRHRLSDVARRRQDCRAGAHTVVARGLHRLSNQSVNRGLAEEYADLCEKVRTTFGAAERAEDTIADICRCVGSFYMPHHVDDIGRRMVYALRDALPMVQMEAADSAASIRKSASLAECQRIGGDI